MYMVNYINTLFFLVNDIKPWPRSLLTTAERPLGAMVLETQLLAAYMF